MKIRTGFVSNSSSSSFVVNISALSSFDIQRLLEFNDTNESPMPIETWREWHDSWRINVDEDAGTVSGWTNMDNGDLDKYLAAHHIDDSAFTYGN